MNSDDGIYIHVNSYDPERWFSELGRVALILLNTDRKRLSIATLGAFVYPYIKLGQLCTFYGYNSEPGAYFCWGYLTDESIIELERNPGAIQDIEDLNAGENLVIFDLVSNLRDIRPLKARLRELVPRDATHVYAVRFDKRLERLRLKRYNVVNMSRSSA